MTIIFICNYDLNELIGFQINLIMLMIAIEWVKKFDEIFNEFQLFL